MYSPRVFVCGGKSKMLVSEMMRNFGWDKERFSRCHLLALMHALNYNRVLRSSHFCGKNKISHTKSQTHVVKAPLHIQSI